MYAQENDLTAIWKMVQSKELSKAEDSLKHLIKNQPKHVRAILALSYLLEMKQKPYESWDIYKTIDNAAIDPVPYFYATWLNARFSTPMHYPQSGVQDILKKLTKKADNAGTLRAMAHEMLGGVETRKGNLKAAQAHYDQLHALSQYMIIGPFENISASGFDAVYPPEELFDTTAVYEGKNSVPASWYAPPLIKRDYWLDFQSYFPDRQAFFYANTFVWSAVQQKVHIRTGTSGAVKVFLNNAVILRDSTETNNDFDTYIVQTELQSGWNRILIKVGYSEIERCNFLMRITDEQGNPIQGLKESRNAKEFNPVSYVDHTILPNPIITSLLTIIQEHPDWIEHYLLLSDAYLRNDKAIEAELLLKEALKRSPDNPLIVWKFLDAYSRGRKKDEVISTYEKLASMSKDIPDAIVYKFNQYLDNEDYDRAEDMLNRIEQLLPGSETAYSLRIRYYDKKKIQEKVIQTVREAHKLYPRSWNLTELAAAFDYQSTRKRDSSIALYKRYLKTDYSEGPLLALAKAYLEESKVSEWEKTFAELLQLSPSSPGFYFQMASVYTQLEQYEKAEKKTKESLGFCPSCNVYWSKIGETYRSINNIEKAKYAYSKALEYAPTDYDSREILRELEGKKSIFSVFGTTNIDSIIRIAPTDKDHPEATAAIISDKHHRVVYSQGASESVSENIIRVFNDKGIDFFKEYRIGYNSNTQSLIIEKAVTIKQDGTEIRADINRNMAVFKALEKNDFIYVKYRIRNYNTGKLAKHVWDEFYFNRFFPLKYAEYSLILPDDMQYTTTQQYMDITPKEQSLPDIQSRLYSWTSINEPGIVYEADMPSLEEVGKVLRFSTIPSWTYLVEWYSELAKTKSQTSYEIVEKIKELIPHPELLSEKEKIAKVFQFITDNIRYSSISFRQSAFIPQKARDVLVNKIGDCKDVSTLGIAMLNELGIKADYVLVNSGTEERLHNILPSISFNHCIIAVNQKDSVMPLYLDLTASNYPPGVIPGPDKNAFSLIIKQGSMQPVILPDKQVRASTFTQRSTIQFSDDNGLIVQGGDRITGPLTAQYRAAFKGKSFEEKKKILQSTLASDIPSARVQDMIVTGIDSLAESMSVYYRFEAPNAVAEAGTYKIVRIPWRNELATDDALSYERRTYPVKAIADIDTSFEEVTMLLPKGYELAQIPPEVSLSNDIADYQYSLRIAKQSDITMITVKRTFIKKRTFIEPDEYDRYKEFYSKALKEDRKQLLLKKIE